MMVQGRPGARTGPGFLWRLDTPLHLPIYCSVLQTTPNLAVTSPLLPVCVLVSFPIRSEWGSKSQLLLKQTEIHYDSQQPKAMGDVASCMPAKWANDSYRVCTAQLVWGQKHWVPTSRCRPRESKQDQV